MTETKKTTTKKDAQEERLKRIEEVVLRLEKYLLGGLKK